MANPQTEDGYTKIANELLDAMCRLHLSGNQWKVLHAIIRKTYGWNKTVDFLTGTQIAEMTGMHSTHVYAALRSLREHRIITWHKRLIAIQKDYDLWKVTETCHNDKNLSQPEKRRKPVTRVTETCHEKVTGIGTHKRQERHYTKDSSAPQRKPILKSEAVEKFKAVTGRYPNRVQIETIDARVTDLDLWFKCMFEWNLRGYKPTNVQGMLDWYKKGGPPEQGPKGKPGDTSGSHAAINRAVQRIKEREGTL